MRTDARGRPNAPTGDSCVNHKLRAGYVAENGLLVVCVSVWVCE